MKCAAAGTNPNKIDEERLAFFAGYKYDQAVQTLREFAPGLISLVSNNPAPAVDLTQRVLNFKGDQQNMKNVYKEQ